MRSNTGSWRNVDDAKDDATGSTSNGLKIEARAYMSWFYFQCIITDAFTGRTITSDDAMLNVVQ
ncbi:MAG: hypothetical protein LBV41_13820 [Cytophagaceae bacterium]|nr:hypothetical protein [Cytophagaceae bacterium]